MTAVRVNVRRRRGTETTRRRRRRRLKPSGELDISAEIASYCAALLCCPGGNFGHRFNYKYTNSNWCLNATPDVAIVYCTLHLYVTPEQDRIKRM